MPRKRSISEVVGLGPTVLEADRPSGRLQIGIITPGWGSSGYYSAEVLAAAADAKVFPAGTHMFFDHETRTEQTDRPERSVRDLAAVLTEDAAWDGHRLVGEAQIFGPYVELLTDPAFASAVGVSIRAFADATIGEAEGRRGRIITELLEAVSVDFVTRAGRGGSILAVLESARPSQVLERAIGHGVAEATASDIRAALQQSLRDTYGAENTWVWVRDFDEGTVWFDLETPDAQGIWQQDYAMSDAGAALLDGSPLAVRARTEYVPITPTESALSVPAPAGQSTTHQESEEDTMPQIEEARLRQLEADAGRVATLETERDQATARALQVEARAIAAENRLAANAALAAVDHPFTALERLGLLADLPTGQDGTLDTAAFTARVETAVKDAQETAARSAAASGAGAVRGFGTTESATKSTIPSWDDIDAIFSTKGA